MNPPKKPTWSDRNNYSCYHRSTLCLNSCWCVSQVRESLIPSTLSNVCVRDREIDCMATVRYEHTHWHFLRLGRQPAEHWVIKKQRREIQIENWKSRGENLFCTFIIFSKPDVTLMRVWRTFQRVLGADVSVLLQLWEWTESCGMKQAASFTHRGEGGGSESGLQLLFSSGAPSDADLPYKAKECQVWSRTRSARRGLSYILLSDTRILFCTVTRS